MDKNEKLAPLVMVPIVPTIPGTSYLATIPSPVRVMRKTSSSVNSEVWRNM
jgi:hypothetical protein